MPIQHNQVKPGDFVVSDRDGSVLYMRARERREEVPRGSALAVAAWPLRWVPQCSPPSGCRYGAATTGDVAAARMRAVRLPGAARVRTAWQPEAARVRTAWQPGTTAWRLLVRPFRQPPDGGGAPGAWRAASRRTMRRNSDDPPDAKSLPHAVDRSFSGRPRQGSAPRRTTHPPTSRRAARRRRAARPRHRAFEAGLAARPAPATPSALRARRSAAERP
jgi:hypothetical protein